MTDAAVAAEIRKVYPLHSKGVYSMAKNEEAYGVTFTAKAQAIRRLCGAAEEARKRPKPKRVKSVEFRARLTPADAERVKLKMAACGIASNQELVETLLLLWEKEEAPTAATVEAED